MPGATIKITYVQVRLLRGNLDKNCVHLRHH